MPIRVMIVNDQSVVRRGLVTLLRAYPDIEVVGESGSCAECCSLARSHRPDVVLCELELPDSCALDTLRTLCGEGFKAPIVVYTLHDDTHRLAQALSAGVRGFLSRRVGVEAVYAAIRTVAEGGSYMDPLIATRVMELVRLPAGAVPGETSGLSEQQLALLRLLASGLSNREIAEATRLSVHTVKFHVRAILRKLDAPNRREAVAAAARRGLLKLPGDRQPPAD